MTNDKLQIVYDKQCPACSLYCDLYKASAEDGQVELLDARDSSALMDRITGLGLDIDDGMVVATAPEDGSEGELLYGAEAIQALAARDSGSGVFNAFDRMLFKHPRLAGLLYPVLRTFRNLLLKLLGVDRINNLKIAGRDRF